MENLETINESILSLMRKMKVDEKLVVPISEWDHTRVYASHLKEQTGQQYCVNRMRTDKTKTEFLLVLRTK